MPGDKKHHTDKFRRCVEQVVEKGHAESAAYAICTTSMQNAGEEVFQALEALESGEERTLHILGSIGTVRKETLNDRSYLVVPIIALMEGVIHAVNADTPEFVSGDVLKRAAASWIGKPVTLGHPAKGGKQCSASDFEVRKASGIGVIMKSEFDGRRLAQEAWIDEEKAKALHPKMYETLANGGTEEVSVGAHVVTNSVGSSFKGKLYKGSWLEASGDHLAFLPGGRGACSCEMGCGTFRAASHVVTEEGIMPVVAESFVALEGKSLDERISMVQQAVDKWNARNSQPVAVPSTYAYAKQVFDDRVIIDVGGKIFSVPYTVSGDEVKFDGEPTAVRQAWVALSREDSMSFKTAGGPGSGNFGHGGRPGEVGGSSSEGGSGGDEHKVSSGPELHRKINEYVKEHNIKVPSSLGKSEAFSEQWKIFGSQYYYQLPDGKIIATMKGGGAEGFTGFKFNPKGWDEDEIKAEQGQDLYTTSYMKSVDKKREKEGKAPLYTEGLKKRASRNLDDSRIRFEGGKYLVYGTGNLRLASHLTRDAAERHLEAIDKILGA